MNKIRLVAHATYRQQVRTGTFLVLTFALPVLMLIVGTVAFYMADRGDALPTVGIVDETGRLTFVDQVFVDDAVLNLSAYADRTAAQAALQSEEIGAYLVVPGGYFEGESPVLTAPAGSNARLEAGLAIFLRRALLPEASPWLLARLDEPASMTFRTRTGSAEVTRGAELVVRVLTPMLLAMVFALMVFTTSSQMGVAMVREKEQRAMEIVVTSLSSRQLLVGKVLGLTLLSLTQLGVWMAGAALALGLALAGTLDMASLSVPWRAVAWALLLGLPGYFLYAVLAAGLGIIAGDSQQARQLAGILGLAALAPLWLMGAIVADPNGTPAVALTLFPLTSPTVGLIRMVFGEVPTWQLLAGFGGIVISLLFGIWAVARIFRAAMLLYGQALRPRAIWQALATG